MEFVPILAGAILVVITYFGLQTKFKSQIATILLYLVTEAEIKYGGKTGDVKYSAVVGHLMEKLPFIVTIFISERMLGELIENAVQLMKLTFGEIKDEYFK